MRILSTLGALAITAFATAMAEPNTALTALKAVPRADVKNVAKIEARDGTPAPERWHILVHNKDAENGLLEYIIAGGELVGARTVSQFAESISPADVVELETVKIDSDRAAKLIQEYAAANEVNVAAIHYELKKSGSNAVPVWKVTAVDDRGTEAGNLLVSAGKGTVVSREGFALEPARENEETRKAKARRTSGNSESERPVVSAPPTEQGGFQPPEERRRRPGFFRRAGGSLQRFFTGRDATDR